LSAPTADQFLDGGFALARMVAPRHEVDPQAPMVLASAPANGPKPQVEGVQQVDPEEGISASQLLHTASFKHETPTDEAMVELPKAVAVPDVATPARPKTTKLAQADPLAPVPVKSGSHSIAAVHANAKDTGRKQ
jgi:hypothetical protein